jgi:hypothetical protein
MLIDIIRPYHHEPSMHLKQIEIKKLKWLLSHAWPSFVYCSCNVRPMKKMLAKKFKLQLYMIVNGIPGFRGHGVTWGRAEGLSSPFVVT